MYSLTQSLTVTCQFVNGGRQFKESNGKVMMKSLIEILPGASKEKGSKFAESGFSYFCIFMAYLKNIFEFILPGTHVIWL